MYCVCTMDIEEKRKESWRVRIRAGEEERKEGEKDNRGEVIDR